MSLIAILKTVITLSFFIFLNAKLNGQDDVYDELTWRDKLFLGVNMSVVNSTAAYVELIPVTGYRITPRWNVGVGPKAAYFLNGMVFSDNIYFNSASLIYGATFFTNYELVKEFPGKGASMLAMGNYEHLSLSNQYFRKTDEPERFSTNVIMIGIGLKQKITQRSNFNIYMLVIINSLNPTPIPQNPFFRFAYMF